MTFEQRVQQSKERFELLMKRLSDTEWSQAAMSDAQSRLATCHRQTRLTNMKINVSHAAADKEHERFVAIKKHGLRHVWYKVRGTLDQSLSDQAKAWVRELKKYQEEEQRLIALKEEIGAARSHLQQCHDSHAQYTMAKLELNDLLDDFFAVATPSDTYENTLKADLRKKQERLVALQSNVRISRHVLHLLIKAHRAVSNTRQILDDAILMETSDLFSYCMFGNVVVKSHLNRAKDALAEVPQLLANAKRLYSSVPSIDDPAVPKNHTIFDISLDSISLRIDASGKLNQSLHRITDVHTALTSTLSDMKAQMEQCEAERTQTSRDMKRLATVHFILRSTIVQNLIESAGARLSSTSSA